MRIHSIVGLVFIWSISACSGKDDGAEQNADAADGQTEAGPCEPFGTWVLHYSAEAGAPTDESILIEPDSAGGPTALKVTFLDRVPEVDACSAPTDAGVEAGPAHVEGSGVVDEATCTLSAELSQSWCYSGEQQCQKLSLTLSLAGGTGSGTATETGGWCMDQHSESLGVSAQKH